MGAIILVTGQSMPRAVPENDMLTEALTEAGVASRILAWGGAGDAVWADADLVLIRTPWDYWSRRDEFLTWAGKVAAATTLRNPVELLTWNSHKGYLLDLQAAGVPTIRTDVVPAGSEAALLDEVLARHTGEIVIKPAVSAGGRGALRVRAGDPQAAAHLADLTRGTGGGEGTGPDAQDGVVPEYADFFAGFDPGAGGVDTLVQPLAASVLGRGEVSLVFFEGEYSHAVRKVAGEGEYRIHVMYGGSVLPHTPTPAELAVARAALAAAPAPTTYGRVDLVDLETGPAVMELELIEPELFLAARASAAADFAAILAGLARASA